MVPSPLHVDGVPFADGLDRIRLLQADGAPVHGRGVVVLHRVLDVELPVAVEVVVLAAHQLEGLEPVRAELLRQIAEPRFEVHAVVREADEDESGPDAEPDRGEAAALPVEPARLLHAAAAGERAVEPVGPGVVGADDGAAAPGVVEQPGAAMAAGVGQGPDPAVVAAHHDRRPAAEIEYAVVAGVRDLVGPPDEVPAPGEDPVDFAPVERIGGVAPRRQRRRVEQGSPDAFVMAGVEDVGHRSGCLPRVRAGIVQKRHRTVKQVCRVLSSRGSARTAIFERGRS